MSFAFAAEKDLPALEALWQVCFGDAPAESRPFLTHSDIRVFAAYAGGRPVSMLCALPAVLVDDCGDERPCAYLYAVCTHPDFRGRGLSSGLLAYAEQALRKLGFVCTALVPANEKLFAFYQKNGYEPVFYQKNYTVQATGAADIRPIDAAGYRALRELQLYDSFVSFDEQMLALLPSRWRVETAQTVCCAAGEAENGILILQELLPDDPAAAAALAARLGCRSAVVQTAGDARPFGMAKALTTLPLPERAYLGVSFA